MLKLPNKKIINVLGKVKMLCKKLGMAGSCFGQ